MKSIQAGFSVTLFFLLLAPVAHGTTVVLDDSSGFSDSIAPNVSIYNEGGTGPLFGQNISFACGSADQADFSEAISMIGGGTAFCGLQNRLLITIIEQDLIFTARDEISDELYEIDLLSFSGNAGCFDNAGGALCADAGGYTSYTRSLAAVTAVPVPAAAWLFGSALVLLGWVKRTAI